MKSVIDWLAGADVSEHRNHGTTPVTSATLHRCRPKPGILGRMADERYPCPCCGHRVFDEQPGSYAICPVCSWEDDLVQLRWPDYAGGANQPSLIEAQRNYQRISAMQERFVGDVRSPQRSEPLDPRWRPVDLAVDRFEPRATKSREWPDYVTLYWWRDDFWLNKSG